MPPTTTAQSNLKTTRPATPFLPSPSNKKTMSITQTYFLAHKARGKLSNEAARPDHNLRLLVGHANLLDSLMLDLAEAEREQEFWFNQSVRGATCTEEKEKNIRWADSVEESEADWEEDSSDSSDSDSEYEEEDVEMVAASRRRVPSNQISFPQQHTEVHVQVSPAYEDEEEDHDEEDYAQLMLTRSPSHSASPPELVAHEEDSSEDEMMPASPPSTLLPTFSKKQKQSVAIKSHYDIQEPTEEERVSAFYQDGYYIPPRNPARLMAAISVF